MSKNALIQLDYRILRSVVYLKKKLMNELSFWYADIDSKNIKVGL